jgi:hypothetical protein
MTEVILASGGFFVVDPSIVDNEDNATLSAQIWKPNVEGTLYLQVIRHADLHDTRNHFISVSGVSNHFTNVNHIEKRTNGLAYDVSCHFLRSNVEPKKEVGVRSTQDLESQSSSKSNLSPYYINPSFTTFCFKYVIRGRTLGGIVRSVALIECFLLLFASIVILYSK